MLLCFIEWTNAQIIDVLSEKNSVDSTPQRGLYQCLTDTQISRVISVLNRPMQWLVDLSGSLGIFAQYGGGGQCSYTGPDLATSKRNFERWVHGLISTMVPTKCLIVDGTPGDVVGIMSAFTPFSQCTTDLEAPGDPGSLGRIIQYNGAGERCQATVGNIGPFGNRTLRSLIFSCVHLELSSHNYDHPNCVQTTVVVIVVVVVFEGNFPYQDD